MIRILDKYFATEQYIKTKSAYGLLKHYQSPLNNYKFVNDSTSPVIILLHIETVTRNLSEDTYKEIVCHYKNEKRNKIVIDTTVEDFVEQNFYDITSELEARGVDPDDITVLTGQNNVPMFQYDFKIKYTTFNVNLFELSYYYFIKEYKLINDVLRPIKPRKLTHHAVSFIKNPRKLRRLLHAYYTLKGYDQYMYNSWHYSNAYNISDKNDLTDLGIISEKQDWNALVEGWECPRTYNDDAEGNGEWIYKDYIYEGCALSFTHETQHSLENKKRLYPRATLESFISIREIPIFHRYFFTEKTYKNFAYGLPFANLGMPGTPGVLGSYGYKCWDRMLDIESHAINLGDSYLDAFKALDKIFKMSLNQLSDIVNSEESLDNLKHNRERFLEQHEFKRLCNALELTYSKYN